MEALIGTVAGISLTVLGADAAAIWRAARLVTTGRAVARGFLAAVRDNREASP